MTEAKRLSHTALQSYAQQTLQALGAHAAEAQAVAVHLVLANLSGHDSHGIGMMPRYVSMIADGLLRPNQSLETVSDAGSVIVVDAQRGFGQWLVPQALDLGMARAKDLGAAVVAVRESGHVGRVGTYSEYCAAGGFASVHFVNVTDHNPLVAPFGGSDARFVTNPFSAALPSDGKARPLLDMATSTIAMGKARVARNQGVAVPEGSLIDGEGRPTTDPRPLCDDHIGALTAFGAHKGSGLAVMCELLAGALTGGRTVQPAHDHRGGIVNNMLSVIFDPAAFGDPSTIAKEAEAFMTFAKASPPAPGVTEVLMPGEPEGLARAEREQHGISIDPTTQGELIDAGVQAGLARDAVRASLGQ